MLISSGRGGHGSIPKNADNALVLAAQVISRLHRYRTPCILGPEWCAFTDGLDIPWLIRVLLQLPIIAPLVMLLLIARGNPLGSVAHAMTQLALTPTMVDGPCKYNVVPGSATVHVDVRTLPGQDEAYVLHHVHRYARTH